jgi:hypothetical protein
MKKVKSLLNLGFILVAFLAFQNVEAQVQTAMSTSPEAMASQQTKYEAAALNLDSKQAKSLGEINLMYAQQMMEIRKKASNENSKNEIEALKRSHSNKIRSLLGTQEFQKYLALKKEKASNEMKKEDKK